MEGNILQKDLEELNIHYGMFNFKDKPDLAAIDSFKYLLVDCSDLKKRYMALGFHLDEFAVNQYYRDFGYDNLYDFAMDNLGLDKSAVSRCVSVWQNFAEKNKGGTLTMFVDPNYADYSYSQLVEMLSIPEKERKKISPALTVKQIREFKKNLKNLKEDKTSDVFKTKQEFVSSFADLTLLDGVLEFIQKKYAFPLGAGFSTAGKVIRIQTGGETYNITFSHASKK